MCGVCQVALFLDHRAYAAFRVHLQTALLDGPFAETKELIAGYWIWQVRSMEEAVEWARRCPDPMPGEDAELELRPIFEAEDFGEEYTPELRERDERLRAEVERQQKAKA